VSVFLNEAARKIIDETADVAGFLWQRGWAERNAGNISVRMAEEDIAESCSSQQEQLIPLTKRFQELGGSFFLVTGKNTRMRDVAASPPVGWDLKRQQAYFDWASRVVAQIRGTHSGLEALFDQAFARRPD